MEEVYVTKNREETVNLGEAFIKGVTARIIALYGDLGSGKTTFVQGLARGLGIKKRIISPTFVIVREYKISSARCSTFYHVDLYRIESEKDIQGLGLEEILNEPQNLVVIEWPEKIKHLLPKKKIEIYFKYLNEDERRITIMR